MGWAMKYCEKCKKVYTGPENKCAICKSPYLVSSYDSDCFNELDEEARVQKLTELFGNKAAELPESLNMKGKSASEPDVQSSTEVYRYSEEPISGVGSAIKVVSVIVIILSVIGSFVIMAEAGFAIGAGILVVSLLMGLLAYGIGEICSLLISIKSKVDKM